VSEKESVRLRRAVDRLMEAQEDASHAARQGLERRREVFDDEDSSGAGARLEEALVDVLDILEGASSDVRGILEDATEEWR
jgi:5-methylcytosine-specific restriction endonuclease McrBC GTP-binding regulatory subunit McrB